MNDQSPNFIIRAKLEAGINGTVTPGICEMKDNIAQHLGFHIQMLGLHSGPFLQEGETTQLVFEVVFEARKPTLADWWEMNHGEDAEDLRAALAPSEVDSEAEKPSLVEWWEDTYGQGESEGSSVLRFLERWQDLANNP
jgi:hypothetical protein